MESWGDSIVADHGVEPRCARSSSAPSAAVWADRRWMTRAPLARGDTDLYLRFPPATYREKVWDHAAGAAVVTAAGGSLPTDGAGKRARFPRGRHGRRKRNHTADARAPRRTPRRRRRAKTVSPAERTHLREREQDVTLFKRRRTIYTYYLHDIYTPAPNESQAAGPRLHSSPAANRLHSSPAANRLLLLLVPSSFSGFTVRPSPRADASPRRGSTVRARPT